MQTEARNERRPSPPPRRAPMLLWFVVAGALLVAAVASFLRDVAEPISYGAWWKAVQEGRVQSASISPTHIDGSYREPAGESGGGREERRYTVERGGIEDPAMLDHLRKHGVAFEGEHDSGLGQWLLTWALLIGGMVAFWALVIRRTGAGGSQPSVLPLGRSRAKIVAEDSITTTFADVAGVDEAVEEVREIVDFLRHPDRFLRLGAKIPKGILLVGLPGTGKTLLARALAGEAGVPFFHLGGSDFVELYAGMGASRVRDLFHKAKQKAPCIVFIDEIDALGKTRAVQSLSGHDEREQTLNALLVEMDGFEPNSGVVLCAATNRPETLDPALLRPGRFDRQVVVDRPDQQGRDAILRVHARDKRLARDVDLGLVAKRTVGLVGADLANLLNEAALLAGRSSRDAIRAQDIEEAIDRVLAGLEKKRRILSPDEREAVAHHEAGHALLAELLPGADRVHKVSIVPRGVAALGFTMQLPAEDRYLHRRGELCDRLCALLGGRAAEDIVFGEVTTGAQNDLEVATGFARRMVTEYGMSERLGLASFAPPSGRARFLPGAGGSERVYSEETAREIDLEVKRILDEQYARAKNLLVDHQDALGRVARRLLDVEVIDRAELEGLMQPPPRKGDEARAGAPAAAGAGAR